MIQYVIFRFLDAAFRTRITLRVIRVQSNLKLHLASLARIFECDECPRQ